MMLNLFHRKYLSPEPTATLGAEQTQSDSTPPSITFVSPTNTTYDTDSVSLAYSVSDASGVSACWYSLNSGANTTLTLSNGNYKLTLYASDTLNNVGSSTVYFTINSTVQTYTEDFSVPSGAAKLTAGFYWYGISNISDASISILKPDGTEIKEFQASSTLIRRFRTNITLPLIDYAVIVYSGYMEITVNNPTPQTSGWKLKVTYNNVTRIDTEVGWS